MATIVPPSGSAEPKTIKLKVGTKSLKLTEYETADTITIFIGGHDKYCIEALLYKPTSEFLTAGHDITEGTLVHIYYNINCSLEHNFLKGVDTNMILKLLVSYIQQKYPYVKKLRFNDTSFRTCNNGTNVELAEMSYIRTGKTWYEKQFHAYMDPEDLESFRKKELNFTNEKKKFTWNLMKSIMRTLPINETITEEQMQHLFENANTWQDFFGPLSDRIGIPEFCNFVSSWLHSFMLSKFKGSLSFASYILPIDDRNTIDFSESNYTRGGKRFTRKYIKKRPMNLT